MRDNLKKISLIFDEICKKEDSHILQDNRDIIEDSMKIYLNDMEKDKKVMIQKLEINGIKIFSFGEIDIEIIKIKEYLTKNN